MGSDNINNKEHFNPEQFNVLNITVNALVFYSKSDNTYTVCQTGKSGAIISDSDLDKAKLKFEEASKIYYTVLNIQNTKKLVNDEVDKIDWYHTGNLKFNYHLHNVEEIINLI